MPTIGGFSGHFWPQSERMRRPPAAESSNQHPRFVGQLVSDWLNKRPLAATETGFPGIKTLRLPCFPGIGSLRSKRPKPALVIPNIWVDCSSEYLVSTIYKRHSLGFEGAF